MDVLYYIGDGSCHNNSELRYSLRSIDKHCKDVDRVWVVGNRPAFLKDVEYLWVEDEPKLWWKNAFTKTKAAIEAGISDKFLLMNDDFFMMADFKAQDYPYYHRGDIVAGSETSWGKVISATGEYLKSFGLPYKHYGVHCPMVIEGKKYLEIEKHLTQPMSARCLYGNLFCQGVQVEDCKGDEIKESPTKCWSSKIWAKDLIQKLAEIYPQPSRWEKENV